MRFKFDTGTAACRDSGSFVTIGQQKKLAGYETPDAAGRAKLLGRWKDVLHAATCAKRSQKVPQGYYNIEVMLRAVGGHGGDVGVCGTCMDARGIADTELTDTALRSSLEQLTDWAQWADRTLAF
jgi:hypothetical protein